MANEEKQLQETRFTDKEKTAIGSAEQNSAALVRYGGFGIVETSIDGAQKHVTVTFQDNKGTYEVGRPQ